MATSLITFVKCVTQSQEGQLRNLGRIRGGGIVFSLLYSLFALGEALSKMFLYLVLQNISFTYFWPTLLIGGPIINFVIYKTTLDRPKNIVQNAFLSSFIPLDFLDKTLSRTSNFLLLYKCIHGMLLFGACGFCMFVESVQVINFYIKPSLLAGIQNFQKIYCFVGEVSPFFLRRSLAGLGLLRDSLLLLEIIVLVNIFLFLSR